MIIAIKLINTSIFSRNCLFVYVVITFRPYSLNNFQVYNTELFITVTMLYVRCAELIHLTARNLYPLTYVCPFLLS